MLSLYNMIAFTFLSLISLTVATPIISRATPASLKLPSNIIIPSTLPLKSGSLSLPPPNSTLSLKHVTIGHGIQNYTCANSTTAPLAIGAIATLYDITALSFLSSTTASQIPSLAALLPLTSALIPSSPLAIPGLGSFPILGFHFFASNGTPVFDLANVGEKLFAKKLVGIKAPGNATVGIQGTGAVDWLALTEVPGMGSVGLKEVYRVDTAGGNPPASCAGVGVGQVISVPYSASYQFFG